MNIRIDKTKIKDIQLDDYKAKCNEALDELWTEEWVRRSVTGIDKETIEKVQAIADKIIKRQKKIVVVTDGEISRLIKAVVELIPKEEDSPEVYVFGDTVSPGDYAQLLNQIDDDEFILLGITGKLDGISLRGAYATLKQLLVSKYGIERAADDIYVIASHKDTYIVSDATQNDCPILFYSEDIGELYAAGTEPVLLLLALFGMEIGKYLEGFREMLSSPMWDLDAADYSLARAAAYKKGIEQENILYWQSQFRAFAEWMEEFNYGLKGKSIALPKDQKKNTGNVFATYFSIERDAEDIMMPYFEESRGDGSLNLLLDECGDEYFFRNTDKIPGVKISVEWVDAYNLGQLFAFVQLSNGITEFLYNN